MDEIRFAYPLEPWGDVVIGGKQVRASRYQIYCLFPMGLLLFGSILFQPLGAFITSLDSKYFPVISFY